MTHIDLFSGIGGFALAAHWAGFTTEVFCEQEPFCQSVLRHHWPAVPVVSDIRDFDGRAYAGADLLTGGFPCQPFSCAGKQRGETDDRFLWPEMLRVIREVQPTWVVGENVAGIIGMALDGVLSDLEEAGYETQAFVLPACAVNAPHRRNRVWIVAHASSPRLEKREKQHARHEFQTLERGDSATNAHIEPMGWAAKSRRQCSGGQSESGLGQSAYGLPKRLAEPWDGDWERNVPRVATGIPERAAQLKALGNAIVPQVAYEILKYLPELSRS